MFIWRWWGGKVGSSGFSGSSTAEQVTHGIDVSALTAIVTGLVRNNAGVMATPFALSRDIIELQFATNHAEGAEITANSLHPGAVMTNLFRYNSFVNGLVDIFGRCVLKNVEQEAATTCYVALHPQVQGKSGRYFADSNLAEACSQANDAELAKKLL